MSDDIEDEFPDPVVRNPPQRIFLAVGNIEEDCDFSELSEVSWSEQRIDGADIEGLIAKIYQLEEQIARLEGSK